MYTKILTAFLCLLAGSATAGIINCAGLAVCKDATITSACMSSNLFTVLGGTWSSANPSIATVNSSGVITGISAGVTTVSYSSNLFGLNAVTAVVTVNPKPTASPTSNSAICAGATLNLSANGTAASYAWKGPGGYTATGSSPSRASATVVASGVYSVTLTSSAGCQDSFTTSVVVDSFPTASPSSNTPVCSGSPLSFTAGGATVPGRQYAWAGPSSFSSTQRNPSISTPTTTATGSYSLTVTSQYGCATTYTLAATVNPLPVAAPSYNTGVCEATTLSLSANAFAISGYAWIGPAGFSATIANPSIAVVPVSAGGVYTLTVTSPYGCGTPTYTVSVSVNPLPTAAPSYDSIVCFGGTLQLSANGSAANSYAWTGPSSFSSTLQDPSIAGVTSAVNGTYSVTVTAPTGCVSHFSTSVAIGGMPYSVSVTQTAPFTLTGDKVHTYYGSGGFTVQAVTSPALPGTGVTYSWAGPVSITSSLSSASPVFTATATAAIHPYTVSVAYNGCTVSIPDTVVVPSTGSFPGDFFSVNGYRASQGLPPLTSCADCAVVQPFHTIISGRLTSSNVVDGENYYLVNTSVCSKAQLRNNNFFVAPRKVLIIDTVTPVTISHCHFFATNAGWWQGIYVIVSGTAAGHLTLNDNTLIENAGGASLVTYEGAFPSGVVVRSSAGFHSGGMADILKCDSVIFNKNYLGISHYQYKPSTTSAAGRLPLTIRNTIFCNKEFATAGTGTTAATNLPFAWPAVAELKTVTSVTGGVPLFRLDSYRNSTGANQGNAGILLQNVGNKTTISAGDSVTPATYGYNYAYIGDTAADAGYAKSNLYDSIFVGIWLQYANAKIYNNVMRNITGAGVQNAGYQNDCKILGAAADSTNNRFYNCSLGISVTGLVVGEAPWDFYCTNALFHAVASGSGMVSPAGGIYLTPSNTHRSYELRGNTFVNYGIGVKVVGSGSPLAANSMTTIANNSFTGKASNSASEFMTTAIDVFDPRSSTSGTGRGLLRIDSNTLTGAITGMSLSSRCQALQVNSNTITMYNYSSASLLGISFLNCTYLGEVKKNLVTGQGYNCSPGGMGIKIRRVGTSASPAMVSCNTVSDINIGFDFMDTSSLSWRNNEMRRNQKGMQLDVNGVLGQQGSSCTPSDNRWEAGTCSSCVCGTFPGWNTSGISATYNLASVPALSPIYVRVDTTTYAAYYPYRNASASGSAYSFASGSFVNAATGCGTGVSALDNCDGSSRGAWASAEDGQGAPGLGNHMVNGNALIFPNPSTGLFTVHFPESIAEVHIEVYDIAGRTLLVRRYGVGGSSLEMDLSSLADGIYLVRMQGTGLAHVEKVTIVH